MESNYELHIFPSAQADMEQIFEHISVNLNNPSAALNQINDFEKAFDNICSFPQSCPFVNNEYVRDKSLRKLIVNNYIAFYRIKNSEIQVVRVIYGMRNYEEFL